MLWGQESQISGNVVSGIDPLSVGIGVNGIPILPIVEELDEIARRDWLRFSALCGRQKRNLCLNVSRVLLLVCHQLVSAADSIRGAGQGGCGFVVGVIAS